MRKVRLTESQLQRVIAESVRRCIKEGEQQSGGLAELQNMDDEELALVLKLVVKRFGAGNHRWTENVNDARQAIAYFYQNNYQYQNLSVDEALKHMVTRGGW